ncbi:hypothetical protein G9A89_012126 [Geosiphon pyriformis]|nr:hypothetical protein G9A89_012126 [Geosiphon pyriformis]
MLTSLSNTICQSPIHQERMDTGKLKWDPKDRPKTAFTTQEGNYEFKIMPFGLYNPPVTFQRLINVFQLATNASYIAFGVILLQLDENGQEQVIAYASKTLKPTELKYGLTELEATAVIWAHKHF